MNHPHPLSLTGEEYIYEFLEPLLQARQVDVGHIDIEYRPQESAVVLRSREFARDGSVGRYLQQKQLSYRKQDLNSLVPYPVLYQGPWPTTLRALRQHVWNRYGWELEAGEFELYGQDDRQAHVLDDLDAVLDEQPIQTTGVVILRARPHSLRFSTGSFLQLIVQPTDSRVRLESLYDGPLETSLSRLLLTNGADMLTRPTLFTATGEQCVKELVQRCFGYLPQAGHVDVFYEPTAEATMNVRLSARDRSLDDAQGLYSGQWRFSYQRLDLDAVIDDVFVMDVQSQVAFERFVQTMLNSYGLRIEPGEFRIASDPLQRPLAENSTVRFQPDHLNRDYLVATQQSRRWKPGSRLTFQLAEIQYPS